jgi:hypothetical protein
VRCGDIREITWTNVQAIESQGDPTQGGIGATALALAVEVNDNGDGIAHITDNGDISTIKVTNVDASNNGGAGLRLESDATGKPAAVGQLSAILLCSTAPETLTRSPSRTARSTSTAIARRWAAATASPSAPPPTARSAM